MKISRVPLSLQKIYVVNIFTVPSTMQYMLIIAKFSCSEIVVQCCWFAKIKTHEYLWFIQHNKRGNRQHPSFKKRYKIMHQTNQSRMANTLFVSLFWFCCYLAQGLADLSFAICIPSNMFGDIITLYYSTYWHHNRYNKISN